MRDLARSSACGSRPPPVVSALGPGSCISSRISRESDGFLCSDSEPTRRLPRPSPSTAATAFAKYRRSTTSPTRITGSTRRYKRRCPGPSWMPSATRRSRSCGARGHVPQRHGRRSADRRCEQLPAPGVHDHSRNRAGALAGGSRVCGRLTRSGRSVSLRPEPLRPQLTHNPYKEPAMAESVYKVIELVGTSPESWEKAAAAAVKRAGKTLRDLRVAEISQLDMQLKDGKVESYRAKIKISFKYEGD